MTTLNLSTSVLEWAAGHIGRSLESLADEMVVASKRKSFLDGKLTVTQAEKLANKVHIPFGFLFLESPPPMVEKAIPDLRQTPNHAPLSNDFDEVLDDVIRKQQWFADYLREAGAENPAFVGRFKAKGNIHPEAVAQDIRRTLGLTDEMRAHCSSHAAYFSLLSEKTEEAGILVFKSGIVKSNTRRGLSVSEFRGFALADTLAPAIFINGKDAEAAWIFTLAHEVAHIWLGESGVSDIPAGADKSRDGVERLCNRIAAELLTPKAQFLDAWDKMAEPKFYGLSRMFKVSSLVIARRALDLGKISLADYRQAEEASQQRKSSGGGNPFNTIPVRNSKRFTRALVTSAMGGHTLLLEAGSLLNVSPNTVMKLGKRMAQRG
jgi:Zn-dependent peptidase ImmA (M78 family)